MAETKVRQNQIESVGFAQMAAEYIASQSLSTNGFQKFPGGLILQWGTTSVTTTVDIGGTSTLTFPTPFLNNHFAGFASLNNNADLTGNYALYTSKVSLSQMVVRMDPSTNGVPVGTWPVFWFAIGN